ncbi:MAG: shikimate kinase [Ruminococcaceae bacterium]|nr:shikimate kinase [Oscillospiraceae bacterium]
MKNIIHIFGASGSGTSTLGRKICDELGYTFMDTDDYFWLPTDPKFTVKRPAAERIELIRQDIEKAENVVISGSLVDWGDVLIPLFTLAIRLDTATDVRIERLKKREREAFGSRIDKGGDMHKVHMDFIEWAKKYDTGGVEMRSKAKHDEWQNQLQCKLITLDGGASLDENFDKVRKSIIEKQKGA